MPDRRPFEWHTPQWTPDTNLPAGKLRSVITPCPQCAWPCNSVRPCPNCGTVLPGTEPYQEHLVIRVPDTTGFPHTFMILPGDLPKWDEFEDVRVLYCIGAWPWPADPDLGLTCGLLPPDPTLEVEGVLLPPEDAPPESAAGDG